MIHVITEVNVVNFRVTHTGPNESDWAVKQELSRSLQIAVSEARVHASPSQHTHIDLMVELYECGMITEDQLLHEVTP